MSATITAHCESSPEGVTVVVAFGAVSARLSQRDALRLWVLLGAATMPGAERAEALPAEVVDAAVAMLTDTSTADFDGWPWSPASSDAPSQAEYIARAFHEAYERLAPEHGYETRRASSVPWGQVPASNRALMVATARTLLDNGTITVPNGVDRDRRSVK